MASPNPDPHLSSSPRPSASSATADIINDAISAPLDGAVSRASPIEYVIAAALSVVVEARRASSLVPRLDATSIQTLQPSQIPEEEARKKRSVDEGCCGTRARCDRRPRGTASPSLTFVRRRYRGEGRRAAEEIEGGWGEDDRVCFALREEHIWWLVNPNSKNLRSLLRRSNYHSSTASSSHGSSLHTSVRGGGGDDASEESSLKRQGSLSQSFGGGGVDRGSAERGLRLRLVATYVDPATNALRELPLPRCVEIWGHPPFGATDEEFDAMMDALHRLHLGGGPRRKGHPQQQQTAGKNGRPIASPPKSKDASAENDPLASRRANSTVFCPALSAYIAIPAVPPKYLQWLKQRRLATKEVRNMMRIGRHRNVVHLYEVLEMVQDFKSTMFLILELVRGGELFDLISSNSGSSRKKKDGGMTGNELHEVTMRKFFGELASGIRFIHSCGVAHRDLKPANLLIHTRDNCSRRSPGSATGGRSWTSRSTRTTTSSTRRRCWDRTGSSRARSPHRDRLTIEMVMHHPWLRALSGADVDDSRSSTAVGMRGLCISGT